MILKFMIQLKINYNSNVGSTLLKSFIMKLLTELAYFHKCKVQIYISTINIE